MSEFRNEDSPCGKCSSGKFVTFCDYNSDEQQQLWDCGCYIIREKDESFTNLELDGGFDIVDKHNCKQEELDFYVMMEEMPESEDSRWTK